LVRNYEYLCITMILFEPDDDLEINQLCLAPFAEKSTTCHINYIYLAHVSLKLDDLEFTFRITYLYKKITNTCLGLI
jgi:hypothetical protein